MTCSSLQSQLENFQKDRHRAQAGLASLCERGHSRCVLAYTADPAWAEGGLGEMKTPESSKHKAKHDEGRHGCSTQQMQMAKDIVHVGAVLSSGAKSSDVELAQFSLLWQFNVVAEITVVSLEEKH